MKQNAWVLAPARIECASLTLISFPDCLISTGDRAFEGAAEIAAGSGGQDVCNELRSSPA